MRRVAHIMGIPISIDTPEAIESTIFEDAFDRLRQIDARFSTYKPGSELSKYQRGELTSSNISEEMRKVQEACDKYTILTDGYFSATFSGPFNPTGYVKGWAIHEAGKLLRAAGVSSYLINAAGDIEATSDGVKTWNIALQNPFSQQKTLGVISLTNGAVATSGTYERGQHIINPLLHQPANSLVSATVYGADIIKADVFATTCIAMGAQRALDFMSVQEGYEALLIDPEGKIQQTQGFMFASTRTAQ
jgi:thiamine biosynthesis lipoprotein